MLKHKLYCIITIWFLLTQVFPPFDLIFRMGGAMKLVIFIGLSLVLFPKLMSKNTIIMLFIYGVQTLLYYITGNAFFETINLVIVPFLIMMSGLLITEYALTYDHDFKYTRIVVITAVVLNVIMAILTIPQLLINPTIIRSTDVSGAFDIGDTSVRYWLIGYHTLHGLPFILAPMIFICRKCFRNNMKLFWLWLISLLLILGVLMLANAAMAFMVSGIVVVVCLLFRFDRFNSKNILKISIVGLLALVMMNPTVMVPVIETVQGVLEPSGHTYQRLDEVKDSFIYGESEGDLAYRQALYGRSQDLFWESPIVGTSRPEMISHHTWIWDRLALYGILFIIPLVLLFVYHIKRVYNNLSFSKVTYVFGVATYFLMLYLKNDFGNGTWLYAFALLPLLCRYGDYVIDNELKK